MGIDHFLRQLRDGELESDSSEDEPEEDEEPQGKISRFHVIFLIIVMTIDQRLLAQKVMDIPNLYFLSLKLFRNIEYF